MIIKREFKSGDWSYPTAVTLVAEDENEQEFIALIERDAEHRARTMQATEMRVEHVEGPHGDELRQIGVRVWRPFPVKKVAYRNGL